MDDATAIPKLSAHSHPQFAEGQLTREFISASLYSSSSGYFNASQRIFTSPTASVLDFPAIQSRTQYYQQLAALYKQFDDCWLTPVELFKPHYAQAIARCVLRSRGADSAQPLRVVEVGGGNGTCAQGVLDYLEQHHPALYQRTHYTLVDLSSANQQRQRSALQRHLAQGQARVELRHVSMLDWREHVPTDVFVICLEVLDNMPHDKVVYANEQWHETRVHSLASPTPASALSTSTAKVDPAQRYKEMYSPVNDPFIAEWLGYHHAFETRGAKPSAHDYGSASNRLAVSMQGGSGWLQRLVNTFASETLPLFVPTTALHLCHVLCHFMPRHRLLVADFTSLPDAIAGTNAPVVSGKEPMPMPASSSPSSSSTSPPSSPPTRVKDYRTYLVELGAADIFFPTHFDELRFVYSQVRRARRRKDGHGSADLRDERDEDVGRVFSTYEFMREYAVDAAKAEWTAQGGNGAERQPWRSPTETRSGWDPLLQDYVNVAFFLS